MSFVQDFSFQATDDYAKDGGEELFTKMHNAPIRNL